MKFLVIIFFSLLIIGCTNLTDADPSKRSTFVKFYEAPYSLSATSVIETPDGFVILGNMTLDLQDTTFVQTTVIATNETGDRIGEMYNFQGGTGKAIKAIQNGYIVVGDSIYVDPFAEQAANVSIASMRLLFLDNSFNKVGSFYKSDQSSSPNSVKADFFGGSVNTTPDGRIIILGTFKEGLVNQQNAPEKSFLIVLNPDRSINWTNTFDLLDNTYQNSRSVHYTRNGNIIWASSISDIQGDFNSSWITIPHVRDSSIYDNFSQLGQTTQQSFVVKDIQPSYPSDFGFGVVGTYSQLTDGSKGNMFFIRADINGNLVSGSDRYFDAIISSDGLATSKDDSQIIDEGQTLCATKDGGFIIAGSITTNPSKGNGGKDIYLVKIDAFGNLIWSKTLGSAGDEVVSAIIEASDGHLIICGTNTSGDYSTAFLMKVDSRGELNN